METLNQIILLPVGALSLLVSWFLWRVSPPYLKQGGPLLILGLTFLLLVLTFSIERFLALWRAGGRGGTAALTRQIRTAVQSADVDRAIDACKRQGGCVANVIGAGLERYRKLRPSTAEHKEILAETRRAIEEASALETPLLERNLNALSTIASMATLLGLMGTTIGMIRAFRSMSHAGAPDAAQLAQGISEALVNTALGLATAIIGIGLYNYFSNRVESYTNTMEESSYEVLEVLRDQLEA
jgi:biopolymer transport protein ExbB